MKYFLILCCFIYVVKCNILEPLSCSNIRPSQQVYVPSLRGGWVALESMSLPRGPGDTLDNASRGAWRAKVCIHAELVNTTTSRLTMLSELHLPEEEDIEIARNNLAVSPHEQGRWSVISNYPNLQGSEMLVIKADPLNYMVLALCLPPPPSDGEESWTPDPNGERYVSTISLLSRRDEREHRGKLNSIQIQDIRNQIAQLMGIQKFQSHTYDTSC